MLYMYLYLSIIHKSPTGNYNLSLIGFKQMLNFSDHKKEIFSPLYIYKPVLIVACGSDFKTLYGYKLFILFIKVYNF